MKKELVHLLACIPLYFLCAICFSCHEKNHGIDPMTARLIELDDSLYFLPQGKSFSAIFEEFDSLERICSLENNCSGEAMLHHIRADLHIMAGHNALAFNETRKLLEHADCEFDEGIYFLTLSNIDIELNLLGKARERLLDLASSASQEKKPR